MQDSLASEYLRDAPRRFRDLKVLADKALAQVGDEDFFATLDAESNSIALLVKHMAGNMISRWTDFLSTDGEKSDRHRDREFVIEQADSRTSLEQRWRQGWQGLFEAIEGLRPEDLTRTVLIRGEPHSVVEAINRQVGHLALHTGQIVVLAKHFRSAEWRTLSIPRGKSEEFNVGMRQKHGKRESGA